MAGNKSLAAANKAKKDEFYTQLADIAAELKHYRHHFEGKTVLCNCDDPWESQFFRFFAMKFNSWGLKKLICTCYGGSKVAGSQLSFFPEETNEVPAARERKAYKIVLDHLTDMNGDGAEDLTDVELILRENPPTVLTPTPGSEYGAGDFRSPECEALLDEADIVVTNPPFSLFREYVAQLVAHDKKFLIIGNQNAITYKEIFPQIKANRMWLGHGFKGGATHFYSYYEDTATASNHRDGMIRVSGVVWFTNLEHQKRHEPIDLYKKYSPEEYPKYENYDAIEVSKTANIPMDYDGVMGVPITFMDKYCPEQFEIIGIAEGDSGKELGLAPFDRKLKALNKSLRDGQLFYMVNGYPQKPYARILIRRKS